MSKRTRKMEIEIYQLRATNKELVEALEEIKEEPCDMVPDGFGGFSLPAWQRLARDALAKGEGGGVMRLNEYEMACKEWLKGCTCASPNKQEECAECTTAFLAKIKDIGAAEHYEGMNRDCLVKEV